MIRYYDDNDFWIGFIAISAMTLTCLLVLLTIVLR